MELDLKSLNKKNIETLKSLKKEREKVIHDSTSNPIKNNYVANELAKTLYPNIQHVKIADITEETKDTKTFVLIPNINAGTKKLAYFKPGQYITLTANIEGGIYNRPYTISCSPKNAIEDNTYTITIRKRPNGIVSNYFFDKVKIDDEFDISCPSGEFYYERLRDAKNVIAIAGGNGINPFMSMAEAIVDGILDIKLTIIYGVKTKEDILFHKRLNELSNKNNLIKVVYVLSEEIVPEYETGLISKEIIDKYLENENSFFVCGSLGLYEHMNQILGEYNLPKKYIRHESFFGRTDFRGVEEYNVKVKTCDKEINITCKSRETLLAAMEKNGIKAPSKCHVGECGFCRSRLRMGKVKMIDNSLREADKDYNYIHPCVAFPESDIIIEIPN